MWICGASITSVFIFYLTSTLLFIMISTKILTKLFLGCAYKYIYIFKFKLNSLFIQVSVVDLMDPSRVRKSYHLACK